MDVDKELKAREALVATLWNRLILDTPDPVINTMFAFAKIRGAESIYDTKGGLMHGPRRRVLLCGYLGKRSG